MDVLILVRPYPEYFWRHALQHALRLRPEEGELPQGSADYEVLLSLYRARKENNGQFPPPLNEHEVRLMKDVRALEKQMGDEAYVRYVVLTLVRGKRQAIVGTDRKQMPVGGKGRETWWPLRPLYGLLHPHLASVDETAFAALCEGAANRLQALYG